MKHKPASLARTRDIFEPRAYKSTTHLTLATHPCAVYYRELWRVTGPGALLGQLDWAGPETHHCSSPWAVLCERHTRLHF